MGVRLVGGSRGTAVPAGWARQAWCQGRWHGGVPVLQRGGRQGAEPGWEASGEQCQALEAVGGGRREGGWLLLRRSPRCQ